MRSLVACRHPKQGAAEYLDALLEINSRAGTAELFDPCRRSMNAATLNGAFPPLRTQMLRHPFHR